MNKQISHFDEYYWIDFYRDSKQIFQDVDELKKFFVTNFPRVAAQILYKSSYFLKKDTPEDLHNRVPRLPISFKVNVLTMTRGKPETKVIKLPLENVQEICEDEISIFANETFKPMDHLLHKEEFNTWVGFKSEPLEQKTKQYRTEVVQPILDFIFEVISNGEDETFRYIISWLSHIICKPYRKTEVALFLHSNEKGTGKGTFGYWLKNDLFGSHISTVISGLSKLTQKHNTCIQRKIFTLVEELPSLHGEFHSQFDTMKHIITDPHITIEPKGIDAFEIPNFANFMLLSNNLMSIKLERGDRRYACFEVSGHKKGDEDYWDHIHNEVLTPDTAKEFYRYLFNLDAAQKVSLRKIPKTNLRKTLIDNSVAVYEQFFEDIRKNDGSYTLPEGIYLPPFEYKGREITRGIPLGALYRCYENYCSDRKEKVLRQRLFVNSIGKYVERHRSCKQGKTFRFYLLR